MLGTENGLLIWILLAVVTLTVLFADRARRERRAAATGEDLGKSTEDPNLRRAALFMQYSFVLPVALGGAAFLYGGIAEQSWGLFIAGIASIATAYGLTRYIARVNRPE